MPEALMAGQRQPVPTAGIPVGTRTTSPARAGALPPVSPDFMPLREGNRRGSTSTPISERLRLYRRDSDQHEATMAANPHEAAMADNPHEASMADNPPPNTQVLPELTDVDFDALVQRCEDWT